MNRTNKDETIAKETRQDEAKKREREKDIESTGTGKDSDIRKERKKVKLEKQCTQYRRKVPVQTTLQRVGVEGRVKYGKANVHVHTVILLLPRDSVPSGLPKGFWGEMLRCDLTNRGNPICHNAKFLIITP